MVEKFATLGTAVRHADIAELSMLNITWLQDANYAKTAGYDADGKMNWSEAGSWASNLSFHDRVRNFNYTDWRLTSNKPVGADWTYGSSLDGSTDVGYNITNPVSELSNMYYVNLALKGYYSSTGAYQTDVGIFGNGTFSGQTYVGLVKNLLSSVYWSGTACALGPGNCAWLYNMPSGS